MIASNLTGIPLYHQAFDLSLGPILHTTAPHYYRQAQPEMSEVDFVRYRAQQLEAMIRNEGPETVAAFIGEPVRVLAASSRLPEITGNRYRRF